MMLCCVVSLRGVVSGVVFVPMGWELGDETCLTTPPFIRSRDALAAAGSCRTRHAAASAGRQQEIRLGGNRSF